MNRDVGDLENDERSIGDLRAALLENLRQRLPELKQLLCETEDHWAFEDSFYRFYHQSFKVYRVQELTEKIVTAFKNILPERPLNSRFLKIVEEGTGKKFLLKHNRQWLKQTRPQLEAFFHAQYFLRMMCKYGSQNHSNMIHSGFYSVSIRAAMKRNELLSPPPAAGAVKLKEIVAAIVGVQNRAAIIKLSKPCPRAPEFPPWRCAYRQCNRPSWQVPCN
jgi:hypothetical protein